MWGTPMVVSNSLEALDESLASPEILLIEDNTQWSEIVVRVLTPRHGFGPVSVAPTLAKALFLMSECTFGLIMVDLNLPDSRGFATLDVIMAAAPKSALLVMTGESDQELALQALKRGAQDYLVKGGLRPESIRQAARYALERQANSLRLQDSEALLGATLDALPAYIAVLDARGVILTRNSRWAEHVQAGNPVIRECLPGMDYLEVVHSCAAEEPGLMVLVQGLRDLLDSKRDQFFAEYSVPMFGGRAWYEFHGICFPDHLGTKIVVSHSDISGRKELESQLRVSDDLFKAISDNVVDLLAIIDMGGHQLYTSPSAERILGYSIEEMIQIGGGMELVHPDDFEATSRALEMLFRDGKSMGVKYRLRHKDGSYRHFESNGAIIGTMTSTGTRALLVARDVTEREEAEAKRAEMEIRLRQSQKLEAIGHLAAGIAHEINTPTQYIGDNTMFVKDSLEELFQCLDVVRESVHLSATSDALSLLRERLEKLDFEYLREEIPKALTQTLEGVTRVSAIVSAMKEFSHPGGANREPVDLNRAIESTITVSRNEWKYVAELETEFQDDLPLVPCFSGELNQVVLNLIVNASHAIAEASARSGSTALGLIRVSTRLNGDKVEIRIRDSGTGIPPEIRNRIFDPFFTTKAVGKGTGQGLAIAHAVVVEKHGGSIDLESEEGRGTTFILRLPLNPVERES